MSITYGGAGAWAAGSTSVTPALPATPNSNRRHILFVGCKPFGATINTPAGWTALAAGSGTNGSVANAIDLGSVRWAIFWRDWQSGDAAPTVSVTTGNVTLAVIRGFDKGAGDTWEAPVAGKGSDTTSGTGFSIASDVDLGIAAGDFIAHGAVIAGNNATFGTPTLTATGCTFGAVTESPATEGATATGNDLEASASYAECTAGPSSAAPVAGWTLSVAQTGGGSIVRLRVAAAPLQIGQALETDSAQPLGARLQLALGQPSETDSAQPLTLGVPGITLGQALETDSAQPIGHRLIQALGLALEIDVAHALSMPGAGAVFTANGTARIGPNPMRDTPERIGAHINGNGRRRIGGSPRGSAARRIG